MLYINYISFDSVVSDMSNLCLSTFAGRVGIFYGNKTNFPLINFNAVIKLEDSLTKNILYVYVCMCEHLTEKVYIVLQSSKAMIHPS